MTIIPQLLTWITGRVRQIVVPGVDFKWNRTVWTHNTFRAFELIFGRACGPNGAGDTIRAELSSYLDEKGRTIYACHSWESAFALAEMRIRHFTVRQWLPVKVWIPVLATPQGIPVFASSYLFAIAFDAGAGFTSTANLSHTITGSNPLLAVGMLGDLTDTLTSLNWNTSETMTVTDKGKTFSSDRWAYLAILQAPSTGTHNVTQAGSTFNYLGATSYSGCSQTGQPDSHNVANSGSATTDTVATTVVASNCWLVGYTRVNPSSGGTFSNSTNTTMRGSLDPDGIAQMADSNGTVATGSQSQTYSYSKSFTGAFAAIVSIKPPGGTAYTSTLTETITNTATFIKTTTRILTQTITSTDTLIKTATRALAETITNADALLKTASRTLLETLSNVDALVKTANKVLPETITNTASLIRSISRNLSEAITNTDTMLRTTTRTLFETITSAATFLGQIVHVANLTETITLAATFIRSITRSFSEAITNTDTLTKTVGRTLSEAITESSTFSYLRTASATISEAITSADTIIRASARTLAEVVTEAATMLRTTQRTLADTLTTTDTIVRSLGRSILEGITNLDTIVRTTTRSLTETITHVATLTTVRQFVRSLTEAITATAVFSTVKAFGRTFTETVTLVDTIRILRNGLTVIWRNASRNAVAVLSNATRAVSTFINSVRGTSTWDNEDRT